MSDTVHVVASIPTDADVLELLNAGALPPGTQKGMNASLFVPLTAEPESPGFGAIQYPVPEILTSCRPTYRFDVREHGVAGSYACVVAGAMGQSLRPYLKSSTPEPPDWHGATHFSVYAIGIVSFTWGDGAYDLDVKRWRIVEDGATIRAMPEPLVSRQGSLRDGGTIPPNLILPNGQKIWSSALAGLYRRLNCTGCGRAHYAV